MDNNNICYPFVPPNSSSNIIYSTVPVNITNSPNYYSIQPMYSRTSYLQNQNPNNAQRSTSNSRGQLGDMNSFLTPNNEAQASTPANPHGTHSVSGNRSNSVINNPPCPIQNMESLLSNYAFETENSDGRMYNLRPRTRQKSQPTSSNLRRSRRLNKDGPPNVTITSDNLNNGKFLQHRDPRYEYQAPALNPMAIDMTTQNSVASFHAQTNTTGMSSSQNMPKELANERGMVFNTQTEPTNLSRTSFRQPAQDSNKRLFQSSNDPKSSEMYSYNLGQSTSRERPHYLNMSNASMFGANPMPTSNRSSASTSSESQMNRNGPYCSFSSNNNLQSNAAAQCEIKKETNEQELFNPHGFRSSRRQYTSEELGICQTILSLGQYNYPYPEIGTNVNSYNNIPRQDQIYGRQSSQSNAPAFNNFWQGFGRSDCMNPGRAKNSEMLSSPMPGSHNPSQVPLNFHQVPMNSNYMFPQMGGQQSAMPYTYEQSPYDSYIRLESEPKRRRGRQPKEKEPGESPATKRTRTTFELDQTKLLEECFQENPYISKEGRMNIAKLLGVNDKQVKIWYQNRRMRERRKNISLRGKVGEMMRKRKRRPANNSTSPLEEFPLDQTPDPDIQQLNNDGRSPYQEPQGRQSDSSYESESVQNSPFHNTTLMNNSQATGSLNKRLSTERFDSFEISPPKVMMTNDNALVSPRSTQLRSSATAEDTTQHNLHSSHQMSRKYQDVPSFVSESKSSSLVNNTFLPINGSSASETVSVNQDISQVNIYSTPNTKLLDCSDYKQRTPNQTSEYPSNCVYRNEPVNISSQNSYLTNGGSVTINSQFMLPPQSTISTDYQINGLTKKSQQSTNSSSCSGTFQLYQTTNSMQQNHHCPNKTTYESESQNRNSSSNLFENRVELAVSFSNNEIPSHFQNSMEEKELSSCEKNDMKDQISHLTNPESASQNDLNHSNLLESTFSPYPETSMPQEMSVSEFEVLNDIESCLMKENAQSTNSNPKMTSNSSTSMPSTSNNAENFSTNYNQNYEVSNQNFFNPQKTLQQSSAQFLVSNKVKNSSAPGNWFYGQKEKTGQCQNQFQSSNFYPNSSSNLQNFYSQEINDSPNTSQVDNKSQQALTHIPIKREIHNALLAANNLNPQTTEAPVQQSNFRLSDIYGCENPSTQNTKPLPFTTNTSQQDNVNSHFDKPKFSMYSALNNIMSGPSNLFNNNENRTESRPSNRFDMLNLSKNSSSGAEESLTTLADINSSITLTNETEKSVNSATLNSNQTNSSVSDLLDDVTLETIFDTNETVTCPPISNQNNSYVGNNTETFATVEKPDKSLSNAVDQSKRNDMFSPASSDDECIILDFKSPKLRSLDRKSKNRESSQRTQEKFSNQIPPSGKKSIYIPDSLSPEVDTTSNKYFQNNVPNVQIKTENMTSTCNETFNNSDILMGAYNGNLNTPSTSHMKNNQFGTARVSNATIGIGSNLSKELNDCSSYLNRKIKIEPADDYPTEQPCSSGLANPFGGMVADYVKSSAPVAPPASACMNSYSPINSNDFQRRTYVDVVTSYPSNDLPTSVSYSPASTSSSVQHSRNSTLPSNSCSRISVAPTAGSNYQGTNDSPTAFAQDEQQSNRASCVYSQKFYNFRH